MQIMTQPDPREAEFRLILEKEVDQQLQLEDLIRKKLIYVGDSGNELYFCFECMTKI